MEIKSRTGCMIMKHPRLVTCYVKNDTVNVIVLRSCEDDGRRL